MDLLQGPFHFLQLVLQTQSLIHLIPMYSVLVMSATSLQGYKHVTFLEFLIHQCQMLLHNHLPSKTGKQTSEIAFHLLQSGEIMELIKADRMGFLLPVTTYRHTAPISDSSW